MRTVNLSQELEWRGGLKRGRDTANLSTLSTDPQQHDESQLVIFPTLNVQIAEAAA